MPAFAQAREEPPERGRRELSVPTVGVGSGARDHGGERIPARSRTNLQGQTCPQGTSQGPGGLSRRWFRLRAQVGRGQQACAAGASRYCGRCSSGSVFLPCGRGRGGAGRHSPCYSVIIVRPREKSTDYVRARYRFPGQFSSVAQSYPTLSDPVDCSTPGFPVYHQLRSLLKLMPTELVMPSNHLILCHPLLPPSVFPSIRVFSDESVLHIRWPKYWNFSFIISPSNEYSGLISFRIDWFDLVVQGTLFIITYPFLTRMC